MAQETTFYENLCNKEGLDLRDNRGKRHNLPLVLLAIMMAMMRHRDGSLSSLHRSLKNNHDKLCEALSIDNDGFVSRSHLPRLLAKVNRKVFEDLLFEYCGVELSADEKKWFAGDGKELRGSIKKGDKRGEVSVQIVSHEDGAIAGQAFYNGTKESEKPCLQQLVEQTGIRTQKLTADALHLHPAMTETIHSTGGIFLIGLKENQQELLEDMIDHTNAFRPVAEAITLDKGHGRSEIRKYSCFDVSGEYFDVRWRRSGFLTLFRVIRTRNILKTNASSEETSFYISNGSAENAPEFFTAIRNHWSIEVNNHYRDVSLKEDQLRTTIKSVNRVLANMRTLVLKLFQRWKPENMVAQMHLFQDDFDCLIRKLREISFL